MKHRPDRSGLLSSLAAVGLAVAALGYGMAPPAFAEDDPWPDLRKDAFDNRPIAENDGVVAIEAPVRAEDAAIVPITMRIPASYAASIKSLTLVVDKNPAPVVATFTFGTGAGGGERVISTRIRVDSYSNVRAVAETADGQLHMATKFVKAAGGCSAPALKDADEALASLGKMQVRTFGPSDASATMREGQLMIRHPNYSGMQMNQLTGLYIPAKFIQEINVTRGTELVFRVEGGISLSENPNIRFSYGPGADDVLEVIAKDTDGSVFTGRSASKGS